MSVALIGHGVRLLRTRRSIPRPFAEAGVGGRGVALIARTNLAIQSAALGTWGEVSGGTVTDNAATAPDGTTTADRFAASTTTPPGRSRSPAVSASTQYTWSAYVKAGTQSVVTLYFDGGNGVDAGRAFNLVAGTSAQIGGVVDAYGTEALADDWYRVWITDTMGAAATGVATQIYSGTAGGSTTIGFYIDVWGMQMEAGAFPSSYIATTTLARRRTIA